MAEFTEAYCTITKDSVAGRAGSPLILRDWQLALLDHLFSRRPDGRRRYRQALIGMPRKNGKSALGAAIALYGLLCEGLGAEVYSCAGDREQARIVFGMARRMVEADTELSEMVRVYRDALEVTETGSVYRVLSAEAYTKEGLSPTLVVFDEAHVQPTSELWDVMTLGSGARFDPLVMGITTAGVRQDSHGRDTLCFSMYQHGQRVTLGEVEDPTFFFAWWEPAAGAMADHRSPDVWAESNPGYGDIVDPEDFAATVVKTAEAEFRTKRTNVFVAGTHSALPFGVWDGLADPSRHVEDGAEVVAFVDGSWNGDATAVVASTVEDRPHTFLVGLWERPEGDPDWRVPVADVEAVVADLSKRYRLTECNFDPFRWQRSIDALADRGLPVAEYPNTPERWVKAWSSFYDAALDGLFTHDGNPALARHVANMVLKMDHRGARPVKDARNSLRHIDAGICAVGSTSRALWWLSNRPTKRRSDFYVI